MRRVMWFTIGLCISCGICVWLLPERYFVSCIVLSALLSAVMAFLGNRKGLFSLCLVFLGCFAGFVWNMCYSQIYLSNAAAIDGDTIYTTVTISDFSFDTDYGTGADGILKLNGKSYRIRVYLKGSPSLAPGDLLEGNFQFRYTAGRAENANTYHSGNGTFLIAYQRGDIVKSRPENMHVRFFPAFLAREIAETIQRCFPEDTFPFAKALLLGDTADLIYEVDTALKISGIRHVVAVSGLHVSILYAMLSVITLKSRILFSLVTFPVLLFFAAMAGFTPSITRACIMCCIMAVGKVTDREYDNYTALSTAVLGMLAINPMVITSVGFQLSVSSVAGIFLLYDRIVCWLLRHYPGMGKRVAASVSVSVSASVFTTPLCALYFGTVSLVSILTNLLTLWVVSFIFCGIILVCILATVWNGGAVFLASVVSVPIRYVVCCARIISRFPFAAVYTQSTAVVIWLVGSYLLAIVFLFAQKRDPWIYGAVSALGLSVALMISWLTPICYDTTMTVLDVGQGQSILIQNSGKNILVDCGGEDEEETANLVAQTLLSQGISNLDAIIITHCDTDHVGGLPYLLTRIHTQGVFYPASDELPALPEEISLFPVQEDRMLSFYETTLKLFSSGSKDSGNESSLCVLFESESCDILITGDRSALGERLLMKRTSLPKVDVLVAGHHGAKDSTSAELLSAAKPETVVISVGKDNRYGHPSPDVLARLEKEGCTVYRTDLNGTITIRR